MAKFAEPNSRNLPAPKTGQNIFDYLSDLGWHYTDILHVDHVLRQSENYIPGADLNSNFKATGISEEQAVKTLCFANEERKRDNYPIQSMDLLKIVHDGGTLKSKSASRIPKATKEQSTKVKSMQAPSKPVDKFRGKEM